VSDGSRIPIYRVLFLCTGNSARSQIAEAVLNRKGKGRFVAESAGSRPVERVNPAAVEVLREVGIDWRDRTPRGLAGLERERWDFVITVCDHAKEACPWFPGQPVLAHWGMPDPADVEGDEAQSTRSAGWGPLRYSSRWRGRRESGGVGMRPERSNTRARKDPGTR
jgi:protein-tyrosine-phosphatase